MIGIRSTTRRSAAHLALAVALLATLAAGLFIVAPAPTTRAATFAVGDTVVVNTDALNLRSAASISASVVRVLPYGTSLTVTNGPKAADGYTWYGVKTSDGTSGWAAGEFLAYSTDNTWTGGFGPGDTAVVDTASLNCRSGPGLSYGVVYVLSGEETVQVLDGPQAADGYHWFKVKTADGDIGWVIGEGLRPGSGGNNNGGNDGTWTGGFGVGDTAVVDTASLNCRSGPGLSNGVLYILSSGEKVTILDGPQAADGYHWFKVKTADGEIGWVIGEGLAPASDDNGNTGGQFAVGDEVVVNTDILNLRANPSLSATILMTLPSGTALTVTGGPTTAEGHTWYQVKTAGGVTGWVAGEFLAAGGDNGGATYKVGDKVIVNTDALNLRSAAGTSAPVVKVLATGTALTVTGGPTSADGYTWYQVKTADGTSGWGAGEYLAPA